MDMYNVELEEKPPFEFEGELIHFVKMKPITKYDDKVRFLVTSLIERNDINIVNLYYNGKRYAGKRISKEKPVVNESYSLMDYISVQISLGEIE